jgi:N6-adenosine-specific RNA methylase IME4
VKTSSYFTAERGGMDLPLSYYGTAVVDPGWYWRTRSDKGRGKSRQYTCIPLDHIYALPIAELLQPDAVVVLWNTQNGNAEGWHSEALRRWGLKPIWTGAWEKLTANGLPFFGTGFHARSCAEFYTVGTRGRPQLQAKNIRNFIAAPWRGESVKPDELYRDVEALYPGPYVDLFARRHRDGWDCWGDQLRENDNRHSRSGTPHRSSGSPVERLS